MKYKTFGKTNLKMPVFSCGGMRYQQSWDDENWQDIEQKKQQHLESIIDYSFSVGINHIETARNYGTSEVQLGKALQKYDRNSFILQTKVAPYSSIQEFEKNLQKSFRLLQVDYIDLFAFHGINNYEQLEWAKQCFKIVKQYQAKKKIGFVGFSTHGSNEVIMKALETKLFDYVNLHWYFFRQKHANCLALAKELNMGTFIISPSDKGGRLFDPPAKLVELCAPFHPMEFNDLFCLHNDDVDTLSLGTKVTADFDMHVEILNSLDKRVEIQNIATKINDYLAEKYTSSWLGFCQNNLVDSLDEKSQLNLYELMRLYHLGHGLDMKQYAFDRYQLFGKKDHWFPGEQLSDENLKLVSDIHPSLGNRLIEVKEFFNSLKI